MADFVAEYNIYTNKKHKTKKTVIRFVNYSKIKLPEKYSRERLLLYIAHRTEDELLQGKTCYQLAYELRKKEILICENNYTPDLCFAQLNMDGKFLSWCDYYLRLQ